MNPVDAADEQRHGPTREPLWNESYYFDFFNAEGTLGGYVRIGLYPNLGRTWYWACLVGENRPLVTVIEHDIAVPTDGLEIRADGIWADHCIEEPLQRMTINLEAFGLELDDPLDTYGDMRGNRVAFGFELDFETDRARYLWPPVTPRYEIPTTVHGRILIGTEEIEFDGFGQRDHSWGAARDWWSNTWCWNAGRLSDGTRFHSAGGFLSDSNWGVGYVLEPNSDCFVESDCIPIAAEYDANGLATDVNIGIGEFEVKATPLYWSPVLLTHDDGRETRFPRALTRFETANNVGYGWIEFNQPTQQPAR